MSDIKPIVPQVCHRLKCNIPSCYGWDLCRQAREECTDEEYSYFLKEFFRQLELSEEAIERACEKIEGLPCSNCGKIVKNRFGEWQSNGGVCNDCKNKSVSKQGKLYKEIPEYILEDSYGPDFDTHNKCEILRILDEAKKEFLEIPLWTGNEPDALIKNLTVWFKKWFGEQP